MHSAAQLAQGFLISQKLKRAGLCSIKKPCTKVQGFDHLRPLLFKLAAQTILSFTYHSE